MSRGTRLTALTAAAFLVLPMAPAAADRGYPVPDDATVVLEGNGSGHGRGLSQYGAYSAAREGVGHRAILGFYYPKTRWQRGSGSVEVLIGEDDDELVVRDVDGLKVREVDSGDTRAADAPATRWRIRESGSGGSEVSSFDGTWTTWETYDSDVEFVAGKRPLTLVGGEKDVEYRGALRSSVDDFDDRVTVNVLPLEHYVRGVVASEMPAGWPQQALRAQAVAARTYAVWRRDTRPLDVAYDICDTDLCQVYEGASGEARAGNKAVAATARDVLTFRRTPIFAEFSASNGGYTVSGGKPYLPSRRDRYEGTSSDYYGWRTRVTSDELETLYGLENLTRIRIAQRDGKGTWGGRVTKVVLTTEGGDAPGNYSVNVGRFVSNFGLRSSLFRVRKVD